MDINRFRRPSRFLVYMLICLHVLTGCATTGSSESSTSGQVGPRPSSSYEQQNLTQAQRNIPKMDVVIPVFSPGLSTKAASYDEQGIWPELRRAEANRFAYKLKQALDNTGLFGAVRVTPDSTASGDIYVLGEITESDGIDVAFNMKVVDASGQKWLDDKVKHEVSEGFHKNPRATGLDAYDPVFTQAADKIIKALLKKQPAQLTQIKQIAELRFGASFNERAFSDYMDTSKSPIKLIALPSQADPMYQRSQSIRVREQLFVDNLQTHYYQFSQQMENSYLMWQKASFTETQLKREARNKSIMKILGGIALIAVAVAASSSGDRYNRNIGRDVATIAAGIGGTVLLTSGIMTTDEAKFHQDAINELGQSIDLEMSSQVVQFEQQSVELTGNIEEQFQQWRAFMAQMYQLEATPDIQL